MGDCTILLASTCHLVGTFQTLQNLKGGGEDTCINLFCHMATEAYDGQVCAVEVWMASDGVQPDGFRITRTVVEQKTPLPIPSSQ